MPLRYFLPPYLAAYFFAAFFWRSFVVWKRTGVNPLVFNGADNAHDYIGRVGVAILLGSLAWTVVAQAHMGESWRIGIDEERRTPLVRRGVFGLSRNPSSSE